MATSGFPITLGGTGSVHVAEIRTDPNSRIVVAGSFLGSVDFNPLGGATRASAGSSDAFVAVYTNKGRLSWLATWGGTGDDGADALAIDRITKNVVVGGHFTARFNFPIGSTTQRVGVAGLRDMFVGTFNNAGVGLSLQQFGKTGTISLEDLEVGPTGLTALTGFFNGSFDADPSKTGVRFKTSPAGRDAGFAITLKTNRTLYWADNAQISTGDLKFHDAAFDPVTEALIVVGEAEKNFDIISGSGKVTMRTGDDRNAFALKFDRGGNLVYSRAITGSDLTVGYGVVVDRAGSAYWTGEFDGTADLDTGSGTLLVDQASSSSAGATFVHKLSTTGRFVWGGVLGGSGFVLGQAITFNSAGNIAVTGAFSAAADFDPGSDEQVLTARRTVNSNGSTSAGVDIFVAEFTASAGTFIKAARSGGSVREFAGTIASSGSSHFLYTDLEPTSGTKRTLVVRWDE